MTTATLAGLLEKGQALLNAREWAVNPAASAFVDAAIVRIFPALLAHIAALESSLEQIANYEGGTDYTMRCGMRGIAKDALARAARTLKENEDVA